MLRVKDLFYEYEEKNKILKNVSFTIGDKEIFGIIGPNGSGKTTLIKLIVGLLAIQEGQIEYREGFDPQKIMFLPSEDNLPEFLTGAEYLQLLSKFYDKQISTSSLEKLLKNFLMTTSINSLISSYSHGMKKKLNLICALLIKPRLLIIDETLNGIDYNSKQIAKYLLKKHINENNASIIFCSHEVNLISDIANQVMILENGEIQSITNILENSSDFEAAINEYFKRQIKNRGFDNNEITI